jgi:hypothetical protein
MLYRRWHPPDQMWLDTVRQTGVSAWRHQTWSTTWHTRPISRKPLRKGCRGGADWNCERREEGDEVNLHGFGKFTVKDSPARQGRNPATGATIEIAASRKLGFTPAQQVKDALAGWHWAGEQRTANCHVKIASSEK